MADLLANQQFKPLKLFRGQQAEGEVISISDQEVVLDLGTKAEGVLAKKDLTQLQLEALALGQKLSAFVIQTENDNGQVILGATKPVPASSSRSGSRHPLNFARWDKFKESQKNNQVLTGKVLEVNKGGLIVEVNGVRGFLPSSQVTLSKAANLDQMIGEEINVTVIEVDANQNRLIFSQKTNITEDVKQKLGKLKVGDQVEGKIAAVLPFGYFVSLEDGVEGLVHISEISWQKEEDTTNAYKIGDHVSVQVISVDNNTGRVNLSIKQLAQDPFIEAAKSFQLDDVVKGEVTKINPTGVSVGLKDGVEGFVPAAKLEAEAKYEIGQSASFLVDSVDSQKRRINLAPFITSTAGLIYK